MTIAGYLGFSALGILLGIAAVFLVATLTESDFLGVLSGIVVAILVFCSGFWYYGSTASGQRALIDEQSELNNGIERVVNVYTADGDIMATYEGKIDIGTNDGGCVKFDFDGKRYIYYNCFIETIADISQK